MPITTSTARQRRLIFWGAMLLLIVVSMVSFVSTNRLIALSAESEHTQSALTELNRFLSELQDVETGARGYVITGSARYLEPYHSGRRNVAESHARLRVIAREEEPVRERLPRLFELSERRLMLAGSLVELRSQGVEPASLLTAMEPGRITMERIRSEVGSAIEAERLAYQHRREKIERQAPLTNIALAVGVAVSLAAIAWLFIVSSREAARRREAEDQLRTLNADLEERVESRTAEVERSKELLNAVIENMPDTVFLKDIKDEFRYVLINGAGERLLGRPRNELLGHVDHELFPRSQAAQCHLEDEEVATSGEQRLVRERSVETLHGIRVVESRKVSIRDPDGDKRFVLGIVRDITDQKSVEGQLREMQRMDAVGRLTGGIAHDFNNILAIIVGNLDLLRESMDEKSEAAEMADEAMGAATHGAELVRRLLAFARKQHLEPTAVDLNERLPAITSLLRRSLGQNVQFEVVPADGLWSALVDPTQVDDALVNLAINARDAMPEGGSLTIETSNVTLDDDYAAHHIEVSAGDYVMLAVSDSGTGMTPEVVARAFEPFYTTKPEGLGTGLGLSQVYGWVKQSGGHIKIYSELGHGTTFKLYLPRADADRGAVADNGGGSNTAPRGHERIFLVEDNANVRSTVRRQLHDLGYSTIEAEDGRSALAMVKDGAEFDLLLTDVVMPGGMTGYELADQVERIRPDLKVLFTSGYTELAAGNGASARIGPLLSKPYRKQELGSALRSILDGELKYIIGPALTAYRSAGD